MSVSMMSKSFDTDAYQERKPQPAGEDAYEVSYKGAVLDKRERNGYDDSDFFAMVWDEESQSVKEVQYATTRGWTYPNSASIDATDEVKAKAAAWYERIAYERSVAKDRQKARDLAPGKKVRVIKGRKGKRPMEVGVEAWVAAVVPGRAYRPVYSDWAKPKDDAVLRVGANLVYYPVDRLEVIDPEQYETPVVELRATIAKHTANALETGSLVNYLRGVFSIAWVS